MRRARATRRLSFMMDEEMARALEARALRQGCTLGFLVRSALSDFLGVPSRVQLGRPRTLPSTKSTNSRKRKAATSD